MTSPDNRARYVVDAYLRDVGTPPSASEQDLLRKLIADALRKAVTEAHHALREKMACSEEPCAFETLCSHHKALAAAILGDL